MQTAAVIPAKGIGDALLMMIASHQLCKAGYQVTTFHPKLRELQLWFKDHIFESEPSLDKFESFFSSFDLIIAENDNSPKIKTLINLAQFDKIKNLSIFYPTYLANKHSSLSKRDQVFDPKMPMAVNIAKTTARLLQKEFISKENGISIPSELIHRLYKKRIVIHPTSSQSQKNWSIRKYLKIARSLQQQGLYPVFVLDLKERENWPLLMKSDFDVPLFTTLDELARYIYESGFMIGNDSLIGHLASNLSIPTLIISDNRERMLLWQPGWLEGKTLTPSPWVPNFKFLKLRERHWQSFVTTSSVLRNFDHLFSTF